MIRGDWGGKPFEDCLAGVEYILNSYPYLDRNRVGALGASYGWFIDFFIYYQKMNIAMLNCCRHEYICPCIVGGYMMNWINGHTNIFKCLVTM
jgi:hypothetical protein